MTTNQEKLEQWLKAVQEVEHLGENVSKRMRKSDPIQTSELYYWIQEDAARIRSWVEEMRKSLRQIEPLRSIMGDLRAHLSLVNLWWVSDRMAWIDQLLI
jgi:GTP1/Obg family GTP-binding protein